MVTGDGLNHEGFFPLTLGSPPHPHHFPAMAGTRSNARNVANTCNDTRTNSLRRKNDELCGVLLAVDLVRFEEFGSAAFESGKALANQPARINFFQADQTYGCAFDHPYEPMPIDSHGVKAREPMTAPFRRRSKADRATETYLRRWSPRIWSI